MLTHVVFAVAVVAVTGKLNTTQLQVFHTSINT
jgi:hypothetical protein